MDKVYRPYIWDTNEMAFRENLQTHLLHLIKSTTKLKRMFLSILSYAKKENIQSATKVVVSNVKVLNKITYDTLKFFGDVTTLGNIHAIFGKPCVDAIKNFISATKNFAGFIKKEHIDYKVRHLKYMGNTPVLLNIGASAFYDEKGNFKRPDSELNTFITATLKHNGLMIVNSIKGYQSCERVADKYAKNRVCIVAGNGAFVSVPDGKGGQIVLQDKRIPRDTALKVYDFFNRDQNKTLLANYYMIVETDEQNPVIVDIASGSWKKTLSGKYDTGDTNLEYALSHAYNIRFLPKVSNAEKTKAKGNSDKRSERMANLNKLYNDYTDDMAKNLLEMPQELLNELNENAELQLGKNGSLCIVPKDCSKTKSAQMIAKAIGLPESQILTLATNCADVCKNLTFEKMQANYNTPEPQNIFDCFAIEDSAIKQPKQILIDSRHFRSSNVYNLKNKMQQGFDVENQRIHDQKIVQDRNKIFTTNQEKMKQDIKKLNDEIKELREKPETEENKKQIETLTQQINDAKLNFDKVMTQFDQYSKAIPAQRWFKQDDLNVKHYTDITRTITDMSKAEILDLNR